MVEVELSERDCLLLLWAITHRVENLRAGEYHAAAEPYHGVQGKLLEALNRTQMQDGGAEGEAQPTPLAGSETRVGSRLEQSSKGE